MLSFGFGSMIAEEDFSVKFLRAAFKEKSVADFFEDIDELGKDGWKAFTVNLVLADNQGNIGFQMGVAFPRRKDQTPFLGCRVLDGTTSEFDWIDHELVPVKELPRSYNPEKGFIVSANNRHTSEHAKTDYGSTLMSTARAVRIDEMLQQKIDSGKKMTSEDMLEILQDTKDVVARRMTPKLLSVSLEMHKVLTMEQQSDLEFVVEKLSGWDGDFDMENVGASLYIFAQRQMHKSLFAQYTQSVEERILFAGNYAFKDFFERLVDDVASQKGNSKYQHLCEGAFSREEYGGDNSCAYAVARSFTDSVQFLKQHVGSDSSGWKWGNLHVNDYLNLPFSKTALRSIYHRQSATGGNSNTPNVSKISFTHNSDNAVMEGTHAGNFKMVINFGDPQMGYQDQVELFSLDTGNNEVPFSGAYFSSNKDHLEGKLHPIKHGIALAHPDNQILYLRHKSELHQYVLNKHGISGKQGPSKKNKKNTEQGANQNQNYQDQSNQEKSSKNNEL